MPMTETEMQTTFGELLNAKVRTIKDVMGKPQLGKKRQVAIKEGTAMLCYGLYLNKYEEPVARVKFADGSTRSVNPKHLDVVKALSPKEAKELAAFAEEETARFAKGKQTVTVLATSYMEADKTAAIKIGDKLITVAKSLVTAKAVGKDYAVEMPIWLVRQRLGDKAESLIAKGTAKRTK